MNFHKHKNNNLKTLTADSVMELYQLIAATVILKQQDIIARAWEADGSPYQNLDSTWSVNIIQTDEE